VVDRPGLEACVYECSQVGTTILILAERPISKDLSVCRIGVGKARASPPSEPCGRFSRTRLSSRQFPHRDRLANGFTRAIPPFRVAASACKHSFLHTALDWLELVQFLAGTYQRDAPWLDCGFTYVSTFLPPFPMGGFLLPARHHPPKPRFRLAFVFSVSGWFPAGATLSSPCRDRIGLTVL